MEPLRKPFQGVLNIIRFNWHFYVLALCLVILLIFITNFIAKPYSILIFVFCASVLGSTILSLLTSFYIYDLSGLYCLNWIERNGTESLIININAGFDETSHLLQLKFKNAELVALDFYNPEKHTEVSIKRARKVYSPFQDTKQITTSDIPFADNSADKIVVILSAHEIRNEIERITFFIELYRIIKPTGKIYITEHLRDVPNFLVYTIGFFHFYSKKAWLKTFQKANLKIRHEIKLTPFISTFILDKNGNTF